MEQTLLHRRRMAIKTDVLESLDEDVLPAAILTVYTSGQFLNFNSHIHGIVVACGGFRADGSFIECPAFDSHTIRELCPARTPLGSSSLNREPSITSSEGARVTSHIPNRGAQPPRPPPGRIQQQARGL